MKARLRIWLRRAAMAVLAIVVGVAAWVALTPLPEELRAGAPGSSIRVEDADGRLLREVRAGDGTRARYATLAELGETAREAVIAAEDRRFYSHPGVDPVAVVRAVVSAVTQGKVVSGASTLTMQLARTVHPPGRKGRSVWGKVQEMVLALRIEASLSKRRILEEYLNRVAFGPNIRGFAAASQAYFGKPPAKLSVAEAALIAGLPRGPSLYSLARRTDLAERRRNRVLYRLEAMGAIAADVAERARTEPLLPGIARPAFGAPHLVQAIVGGSLRRLSPGLDAAFRVPLTGITTTLDGGLQRAAETAVAAGVRELAGKQVTAASAVVIDNATGDVLAYVGSPDFADESRLGQNDGVRALRQPGSTLKPFLYALALEKLGFTAATALPDIETRFPTDDGDFVPHDYDGKVRGPVRLREALGNSLNIPAVWTLVQMGVEPFLGRLHDLGFTSLTESPGYYGPALALGDGEVTLLQLANAYATLARGGLWREFRVVRAVEHAGGASQELPDAEVRRLMPAPVAAQITEMLRDPRARTASFGDRTVLDFDYPVAAKTGTSKGYRDNWVVGYTDSVTVAVWAGNFDGSSMGQVSGITGAGPIFHAVMDAAARARGVSTKVGNHDGLRRVHVCALSGGLATSDCPHAVDEWVAPDAIFDSCTLHERVRVTRADGLRAGAACSPDEVVEHVYERCPPEYAPWAAGASRPVAPDDYSALCPGPALAQGAGPVRITYPSDGARFVMDPERDPSLQLLGVHLAVPEGTREVALLVDGLAVAHVRSPFVANWALVPGEHVIAARTESGDVSDGVGVRVRGL
jgi:penicillin-binding protein 1C